MNTNKLEGKVAIVTGASKGIGAGIALGLAEAGAAVIVNYANSEDSANNLVRNIESLGGRAHAVKADVSNPQDVQHLFSSAREIYGRLDILVNNAGVFKFEPIEEVVATEFYREFGINVLGTILCIKEATKYFGDNGGSIINISSVISKNPVANSVVYAATKASIDSITIGMSRELGPRKIRVNSIAPGVIFTEGVVAQVGEANNEFHQEIIAMTPLRRVGTPADVARAAVFLASDDSAWLTGEYICSSGGWR